MNVIMVWNPKRIVDRKGRPIYGFYIGDLNDFGSGKERSRKFDYEVFDKLVRENSDVVNENMQEVVDKRREILIKSGYSYLRSGRNSWIGTERAEADRVNNVFNERYKSLQNRQERYWDLASSLVVDSMTAE